MESQFQEQTSRKSSNQSLETPVLDAKAPEHITQRKLQEFANNTQQVENLAQLQAIADANPKAEKQDSTIQKKENNTGLPDNLKTGIENLSGYSMNDVKVHYNSSKPAQLNAHAYAQGSDIHLAAGQEKHLPHEAWHVVQQKQGRVKPNIQMKGGENINNDAHLEKEADEMGSKALLHDKYTTQLKKGSSFRSIIQRKIGAEIEVSQSNFSVLDDGENKLSMTQGQTVGTLASSGGNVFLKAEGPNKGDALAEFVTQPYDFETKEQFLTAIKGLSDQAKSISKEHGAPDWTLLRGDSIKVNNWPTSPKGGFQFTISPKEGTVSNLFDTFSTRKTPKYDKGEHTLQEEEPERKSSVNAIQDFRILVTNRVQELFWNWFILPANGYFEPLHPAPTKLRNVIISITEAVTWRLGLLVTDTGSTIKNALNLMPKFDLEKLFRKHLESILGTEQLYSNIGAITYGFTGAYECALNEHSPFLMKVIKEDLLEELKFHKQQELFFKGQVKELEEYEEYERIHQQKKDLGHDFAVMLKPREKMAYELRLILEINGMLENPVQCTMNDINSLMWGNKKFLGDINTPEKSSILEDEGSLIETTEDAPEGAFEHRNPFDGQINVDDWVDATKKYLEYLNNKGIWF